MRKLGKKNNLVCDLSQYSYILSAVPAFGKTTMFFQMCNILYKNNESGLLISVGNEPRPLHIQDAFYEEAPTFDDLLDIIDELCKNRLTEYKDIKFVGIDTLDEVFNVAESYVVNEYNDNVDANKQVNTISKAYGGYRNGENRVKNLVVENLLKLKNAGYGLFMISHTKIKNKKDLMTDIEFEQLTSSISADYFNSVKNVVNFSVMGYIDREFTNLKNEKDVYTKGNKKVGELIDEQRVLCFRDSTFTCDCKSHLPEIEEKVPFSAENFVNTITDAVKKELEKARNKVVSYEELKDVQEQQHEEHMEQVEQLIQEKVAEEQKQNDEQEKERILQKLVGGYKTMSKEKKLHIKQVLTDNGATKLQELSVEVLKTLL